MKRNLCNLPCTCGCLTNSSFIDVSACALACVLEGAKSEPKCQLPKQASLVYAAKRTPERRTHGASEFVEQILEITRFKSPAQRRLFQTQKTLRSSHLAPLCICLTLHMSSMSGFNLMFIQCASSHMFVFWLLLVAVRFKCFQGLEVA